MSASHTSISQLKLQLQTVLLNIKTLEQQLATGSTATTAQLKQQTNQLLLQIEQAPLTKFAAINKKRKRLRQLKKVKRKLKKFGQHTLVASQQPATVSKEEQIVSTATVESSTHLITTPAPKPHHQLRNYYNAQRFLRIFELLKILHLERGQDAEATRRFATQFANLRAVWNSVLLENFPQRTQARKIEDQWDEVFFGPSERVYYSGERKIGEFLRIRRTWDSYLTRSSKRGSCIPCGWVLPTADALPSWQQYRVT